MSDDLSWMNDAECRYIGDWELFFPEGSNGYRHTGKVAKRVCAECPVQDACLEYIMNLEGDYSVKYREGIWGGLTPRERSNLYRERAKKQYQSRRSA